PVDVVRGRPLEAAADDHAVAAARVVVARRAEDVEAVLAAAQQRHGDLRRTLLRRGARSQREAVIRSDRLALATARHGAGRNRPRRQAVGVEGALPERAHLVLVVHVLPATRRRKTDGRRQGEGRLSYG